MEVSIKSISLLGALVLTGLSAGLFYAWSVSVIPGTKRIGDLPYLQTMQSINRAILNPSFFVIFFGSILLLGIATLYEFQTSRLTFGLMLTAAVLYLVGTIGVTGMGNVPLNNELDVLNIVECSSTQLSDFRKYYESKWNQLHAIRTVFAVLSFLLAVLAILIDSKRL